ncbi:MAG: HAMP domain-containing histidine kinase, partial [Aquificae bacterium]|nr:HAMP domain-containing histidine kinase [Aquificota bacterium]
MKKNFLTFEYRVLLTFTLLLAVGLSAINLVALLFFKYHIESQIYKEARLYAELYKHNPNVKLPSYIKLFDRLPDGDRYEIIGFTNGRYLSLDREYKEKKIREFALILLLWDGVLILSIMLLLYFTIVKYIKKEEYLKKYLHILMLTITHKLGNFLSVQRVNIDLIKAKCNIKAVERLEKAYILIEKDFKFTINTLKNLENTEKEIKLVNLKDVIGNILSIFSENLQGKKVYADLKDIRIKADPKDVENAFFNLIENAVKFSRKNIHIKMCRRGKTAVVIIKNDVGNSDSGAGVGIEIARFLLS